MKKYTMTLFREIHCLKTFLVEKMLAAVESRILIKKECSGKESM